MAYLLTEFLKLVVISIILLESSKHVQAKCKDVPGFIYILNELDMNQNAGIYYKIGGVQGEITDSEKINTRKRNLQTGNPRKLLLSAYVAVKSCKNAENAVQKDTFLQGFHINNGGGGTEWYKVENNQYLKFMLGFRRVVYSQKIGKVIFNPYCYMDE